MKRHGRLVVEQTARVAPPRKDDTGLNIYYIHQSLKIVLSVNMSCGEGIIWKQRYP
jgi:hypothetical protein